MLQKRSSADADGGDIADNLCFRAGGPSLVGVPNPYQGCVAKDGSNPPKNQTNATTHIAHATVQRAADQHATELSLFMKPPKEHCRFVPHIHLGTSNIESP